MLCCGQGRLEAYVALGQAEISAVIVEAARRDHQSVEATDGDNVLRLTVAIRYLKKLRANVRVARYLAHHHAEVEAELQQLIESPDLAAIER